MSPVISLKEHHAVIFDLDGVLTKTARVHAAAWKELFDAYLKQHAEREGVPFHPFDAEADYGQYVDGKPRYDGVKSFLDSRGISLPWGTADDPPDAETICGLGNKKNAFFVKQLEQHGVEVFDSTVALIQDLRKHHIKTAIISSSKNCSQILQLTKLGRLFDVKIDGTDSLRLKIKGKPEPDIFLAAVKQLGVSPQHAVVVEDAISGVQAGQRGRFALVIGVDRIGQAQQLKENGAHIVVKDLAEVSLSSETGERLHALEALPQILQKLKNQRIAIFLDYDGTLTPIVSRPDLATLQEEMRQVLQSVGERYPVAIVSGRDRRDVKGLVQLGNLYYAGSHGFDISGPKGESFENEEGKRFLPILDAAEQELKERVKNIEGSLIERKKYAIAIHYRLVAERDVSQVEAAVEEVHHLHPELRKGSGKKVFELQPAIEWNKGKALFWLLTKLGLDKQDVCPLYIGDDVTDEDAFRVLIDRGIGIAVQETPHPTAAAYTLKNPDEVQQFLDGLNGPDGHHGPYGRE